MRKWSVRTPVSTMPTLTLVVEGARYGSIPTTLIGVVVTLVVGIETSGVGTIRGPVVPPPPPQPDREITLPISILIFSAFAFILNI